MDWMAYPGFGRQSGFHITATNMSLHAVFTHLFGFGYPVCNHLAWASRRVSRRVLGRIQREVVLPMQWTMDFNSSL